MSKPPIRRTYPSISLERVKELALGHKLLYVGDHASRNAEDYFDGTSGLVKVIAQLTESDFSHSQTDKLPVGCNCADVYKICTDGDKVRQTKNVYDVTLAEYYLKFALKNGVLLLMLSNHPSR